MRRELAGSLLAHCAVVGAALVGFAWPEPEDAPAVGSVEVEIVSLATVSSNSVETVESSSTLNMLSAGAAESVPMTSETLEPVEPTEQTLPPETVEVAEAETSEPIEVETSEPAEAEIPEPAEAEPVTAEAVESVEPVTASETLLAAVPSLIAPQEVVPLQPETPVQTAVETPSQTVEAVPEEDVRIAPVPQTPTIARRSEPTYPPPQPRRETPPPQQQQQQPPRQQTPPTQSGNAGRNEADSVAAPSSAGQGGSAGTGGSAEVARYPSQVVAKLRHALRYPSGAGGAAGDVHVTFTVAANGSVGGIGIARSSGNAALDQAGIETVRRAAPFPPIPAGAGRQSWTFTVPLGFVRN